MDQRILCVGELLIDFFCSDPDTDLTWGEHFIKKAGGAPANVAVTMARLGKPAWLAGRVGQDAFGDFLEQTLCRYGVNTTLLKRDPNHPTTLAFVSVDRAGERDFMFHRGADAHHEVTDLGDLGPEDFAIAHFGSATALLPGTSRATYLELLKRAKASPAFVSFDPNHRADLWPDRATEFAQTVLPLLAGVDLLKVSEAELAILTGTLDPEEGARRLHGRGAGLVAITLGSRGTWISNGSQGAAVPAISIQSVDSTGAGDAFVGAFLSRISELPDPARLRMDFPLLREITDFANRVGALACTRTGAMDAIPTWEEVMATRDPQKT